MRLFLAKIGIVILGWMLGFGILFYGDTSAKGLITVGVLSTVWEFGMWGAWVLING